MVDCSLADFGGLAEGVLQAGASLQFQARGGSMTPTIRDGDTLLISPVRAHDLSAGQIVLCQTAKDKLVVHRILERRQQQGGLSFLLKGDRCDCPDGWVDGSSILGRAVQASRQGKAVQLHGGRQRVWGRLAAVMSAWNLFDSPLVSWLFRAWNQLRRFHISSSGAA